MNRRDLGRGSVVYHNMMVHWGRGTVIETRRKDLFGYRTAQGFRVKWEKEIRPGGGVDTTWERSASLRRTPNVKKIALLATLRKR